MKFEAINELLDHPYLPLENGWVRNDDGTVHVAARTHMIGCTGEMVKWWFGFIHHTEEYLWWHPRDHIFSDWIGERGTGRYIGGTHIVDEYLAGEPELQKLKINFRDPSERLDTSRFAGAKVSAAIHGRVGLREPDIWTGYLLHLIQDIPEGCVMRSRFWLGHLDPAPPGLDAATLAQMTPDSFAQGLQQHASEEMSILANILPGVYRMYNPNKADAERPLACA